MLEIGKGYPILALTGPRQAGKTTFLRREFSNYRYVNMENPDNRSYAINDPKAFFEEYDKYVIFDEIQRVPMLFSYIQAVVDDAKIMSQYIFSGSQNFHLMENISQSLSGRVAIFKLFPFDFVEMKSSNYLDEKWANNAVKGFYPALYDRNINSKVFYSNYMQTYIERDLLDLLKVKDIRAFRNFVTLCAGYAGGILNLSNISKDCGISPPTAKAWLSVLELSFITYQLPPYFINSNKRVIRSPKLYFYDTGLLCYLLKIKDAESLMKSHYKGAVFENMAVSEYVKQNYHQNMMREYFYWRDVDDHEVDLIWQVDEEKFNLIEMKSTTTIMSDLFKGLNYFEKIYPQIVNSKTLLYGGLENQKRTGLEVISWKNI
jgi:uncharacterized protein